MQKKDLTGMVILLKQDKSLIQTKKIRICQREKLVDKMNFLIPLVYEGEDMTKYSCLLIYKTPDLSPHAEMLVRLSDGYGGYEDYEDADGNKTHMIMRLPIDTQFTNYPGNIELMLSLQFVDYDAQTTSPDDEHESPNPGDSVQHVFNTLSTWIEIQNVVDYYSIVTDQSISMINNWIAKLEADAEILAKGKADNINLNVSPDGGYIYLTSQGQEIGDRIPLNSLGDGLADFTKDGLVKVITDEDVENDNEEDDD